MAKRDKTIQCTYKYKTFNIPEIQSWKRHGEKDKNGTLSLLRANEDLG